MCYDISFTVNMKELSDYFPDLVFDDQLDFDFGPIDHIQGVSVFAPHPIIYVNRQNFRPHCKMMEWGCIEYTATAEPTMEHRNGRLNIRSERVLDDPSSYWHKIRNRRCLQPVTGIYEHREVKGWPRRVPYIIRPREAGKIFFLPGLYSVAQLPDKRTNQPIKRWTFGHMTRPANAVMRNIHNSGDNRYRMPLLIPFEMAKAFLSEDLTLNDYRAILNFEMASEDLEYHTVSTVRTSKPRPDGKGKHEYWKWEGEPELGLANPD